MSNGSAPFFQVVGPPILPPPPGSVRAAQYLKGFKQLVGKLGGEWSRILAENEIDAAIADDPDHPLPWTSATSLLEYCSKALNDDVFGLHLAAHQDADVYGCVTAMARAAPTLRQGIDSIIEFVPLFHSPGASAELLTGSQTAELRWHPSPDFSYFEQANYHGLLLGVKLLRAIAGDDFRPAYATSVTSLRHNRERIERGLGCTVTSDCPHDAIGFAADKLDQPREGANSIVFALLASYLSQLKERREPTIVEQVEGFVSGAFRSPNCTIIRCAAKIGTSPRTLQKWLTEQGTSFSSILEDQRIKAAKSVLASTDNTLDEVAEYLGYSEKSSFARAFKRATSLTPQAFRLHERSRH